MDTEVITSQVEAVTRAAKAVGGLAHLGRLLGVTKGAVMHWKSGSVLLPADRAVAIERETGISRKELRPDLWPVDAAVPQSEDAA